MITYSIGIVTYIERYEKYFKPLIKQIKFLKPEIEIIVCINGENKKLFDSRYRSDILRFLSNYENIFPSFCTTFRSLSKLWNTCLINSSNDLVLLLNDDTSISSHNFFVDLEKNIIANNNKSFKINGSWSHALLDRKEVDEVGWFDERYLGVGEEDGDFEWRWQRKFQIPFINRLVTGIINHVEQSNCLKNIKKINTKYSAFNHDFAFNNKYEISEEGKKYGIMGRKLICKNETPILYPTEKFYWCHKDDL